MKTELSMMNLAGKKGLILGAANEHSIAWGCALMAKQMGADVMVTCLNEKARPYLDVKLNSPGLSGTFYGKLFESDVVPNQHHLLWDETRSTPKAEPVPNTSATRLAELTL